MARDPFVRTTTKKLNLGGDWEGEWIEVKENLGVRDKKHIAGSGFTTVKSAAPGRPASEAEAGLDLGHLYMTQLKTYVVAWSFTRDGQPVECTPTAIDMLEEECADEMTNVLRKWLDEVRAAREANPTTTTNSGRSLAS